MYVGLMMGMSICLYKVYYFTLHYVYSTLQPLYMSVFIVIGEKLIHALCNWLSNCKFQCVKDIGIVLHLLAHVTLSLRVCSCMFQSIHLDPPHLKNTLAEITNAGVKQSKNNKC